MDNIKLNKYMKIDYFYDLLLHKRYMLIRPEQWDDPYENFIGNFFKDEKKYHDLYFCCTKLSNECHNKYSANVMLMKLWLSSQAFVCTCFTHETSTEGVDAMWRSYSYDKRSIRFSHTNFFLSKGQYTIFLETGEPYIGCKNVKYENFDVFEKIKQIIFTDKLVPTEFIYTKRRNFEYEKEIRIFAREPVKDSTVQLIRNEDINTYDFSNFHNFVEFTRCEIKDIFPERVPYEIDARSISDIVVHPLADESTIFFANQICKEFGLGEARKSKIYEFKY
ncbi:MAG: hypothetical protein ACERKN_09640 [Velocimicrobium sp.]